MDEFKAIFDKIRAMFAAHEDRAIVLHDERGRYYLATHEVRAKDGYRTWFGGVEIKKNYVSVHLIPVYVHPELLGSVSEPLKKRMQGKSCFNFKKMDGVLLDELHRLVGAGAERFVAEGRFS